jgi:hypothetical protein
MTASYVIIGIHGLANKPPADVLQDGWCKALVDGLERNEGRTAGAEVLSFQLVYWADWNYPHPIRPEDNPEPYIPAEGTGPLPAYGDNYWDTLRAEATEMADRPIEWFKEAFGVHRIADEILAAKLNDLALYYSDPSKRKALRDKLARAVRESAGRRIMVIAHSMGSIVAYDVLRLLGREDPGLRIAHFVTIGSPLGLPHVKYRIYQENDLVRTPSIVERWTNFADRHDVVAVDTHLADDFEPNDRGVRVQDDLVLNGYRANGRPNHHKSYGYLRSPELSRLARGFI